MQQRRKGDWHPLLVKLIQFAVKNPKLARKLVKDHPEVLTLRTGLGETALHYLAVENHAEAVQLLIDLGADVNVRNNFGASAIEEAIQVDAKETIEVLRRAGAAAQCPSAEQDRRAMRIMTTPDWPFDQPPNCAVITLLSIAFEGAPILHIAHDEDDHGWQFLGLEDADVEQGTVLCLADIVKIDPSVLEVADLPPGWHAWRQSTSSPWQRERMAEIT